MGPWGSCSDSCSGPSKQTRDVFCVVKLRGHARITTDMVCPTNSRPVTEQNCDGSCSDRWYTGDWTTCDENCPSGVQRREVRCLNLQGKQTNACNVEQMPLVKRTCICSKHDDFRDKQRPSQDQPQDRKKIFIRKSISQQFISTGSCQDHIRNCYLAVQARLCQYPYYKTHCCVSCAKAHQETVIL